MLYHALVPSPVPVDFSFLASKYLSTAKNSQQICLQLFSRLWAFISYLTNSTPDLHFAQNHCNSRTPGKLVAIEFWKCLERPPLASKCCSPCIQWLSKWVWNQTVRLQTLALLLIFASLWEIKFITLSIVFSPLKNKAVKILQVCSDSKLDDFKYLIQWLIPKHCRILLFWCFFITCLCCTSSGGVFI